ncbi:hypothetical protein ES332_D11G136900v1 [Gossypium tomentosum]|nr:hypothetical protein ES332_D11G136900v1 [Gossypium tomentosum]
MACLAKSSKYESSTNAVKASCCCWDFHLESINHFLRGCSMENEIWTLLQIESQPPDFFNSYFETWLMENLKAN